MTTMVRTIFRGMVFRQSIQRWGFSVEPTSRLQQRQAELDFGIFIQEPRQAVCRTLMSLSCNTAMPESRHGTLLGFLLT